MNKMSEFIQFLYNKDFPLKAFYIVVYIVV